MIMSTVARDDEWEQRLAALWHEIATFPYADHLPPQKREYPLTTQIHPGYVGPSYRKGGLLFIAMNRGGSTDDPYDKAVLDGIKEGPSVKAYSALTSNVLGAIRAARWPVIPAYIRPIMERLGQGPEEIAYINAVPFQVGNNRWLGALYPEVWSISTGRQVALIDPGAVVFLGVEVGRRLEDRVVVPSTHVDRVRGSNPAAEVQAALTRNAFLERAQTALAGRVAA